MNGLHDTSFKLSACIVLLSLLVLTTVGAEAPTVTRTLRVRLTVETPLSHVNTPLDPAIDFPELIRQSEALGVLDPNSIEVRNTATNKPVPHALTEDFAYSDKGRVEFVVADQRHTEFEIPSVLQTRKSLFSQQGFWTGSTGFTG